jgi:hypothetical protein
VLAALPKAAYLLKFWPDSLIQSIVRHFRHTHRSVVGHRVPLESVRLCYGLQSLLLIVKALESCTLRIDVFFNTSQSKSDKRHHQTGEQAPHLNKELWVISKSIQIVLRTLLLVLPLPRAETLRCRIDQVRAS